MILYSSLRLTSVKVYTRNDKNSPHLGTVFVLRPLIRFIKTVTEKRCGGRDREVQSAAEDSVVESKEQKMNAERRSFFVGYTLGIAYGFFRNLK